jgi:branched-chain amino acid transport system permease protein
VLGGFGSLWGALAGGILVGLLQAYVGRYVSTTYETFIAFSVLLVFLAVRPQGIFGSAWESHDA